jgi:D-alanyl-D-alanine carboxypeptidase
MGNHLASQSLTTDVPPNTPERAYGLGFGRENGWIGHTGELPNFNSSVQYDPKDKRTIVAMVNSDLPKDKKNPAPEIVEQIQQTLGRAHIGLQPRSQVIPRLG